MEPGGSWWTSFLLALLVVASITQVQSGRICMYMTGPLPGGDPVIYLIKKMVVIRFVPRSHFGS